MNKIEQNLLEIENLFKYKKLYLKIEKIIINNFVKEMKEKYENSYDEVSGTDRGEGILYSVIQEYYEKLRKE